MNIKTSKSIFWNWMAIDDDSYDGAEDSLTRHQIGFGHTEEEAINELLEKLDEE